MFYVFWFSRLNHVYNAGIVSFIVLAEDLTPSPLISFNEALQHFQTTDLGDLLVSLFQVNIYYDAMVVMTIEAIPFLCSLFYTWSSPLSEEHSAHHSQDWICCHYPFPVRASTATQRPCRGERLSVCHRTMWVEHMTRQVR